MFLPLILVLGFSSLNYLISAATLPDIVNPSFSDVLVRRGKGEDQKSEPVPLKFACTKTRENCANMCYAANCLGKPGIAETIQLTAHSYLKGKLSGILHYDEDANDKNRKVSGYAYIGSGGHRSGVVINKLKPFRGGPEDDSVDEWPPASTIEGGKDASLRLVPVSEQRVQGGQTPKADAYFLVLSNWSDIPECEALSRDDKTGCRKNQRQFRFIASSKELVQA